MVNSGENHPNSNSECMEISLNRSAHEGKVGVEHSIRAAASSKHLKTQLELYCVLTGGIKYQSDSFLEMRFFSHFKRKSARWNHERPT